MKKLLAALIMFTLLFGCALAERHPQDPTPITINGVRAAFFDGEGNFLPAVSVNGVTYVPFEAFCAAAQVEAAQNGKVVLLGTVPVGLFDAQGNYLPPLEVSGLLYVPLEAFAKAAGLTVEKNDNGWFITPMDGSISASTAEPAKQPETLEVPICPYNFTEFFSWKISCENLLTREKKSQADHLIHQYWSVDYVLNVTALTGYPFKNVRFTIFNDAPNYKTDYGARGVIFSNMVMPQSGQLTQTKSAEGSYVGYKLIDTASDLLSGTISGRGVSHASGTITLPYEEGLTALNYLYNRAGAMMKSSSYQGAYNIYSILGDYKNSVQLAQEANAILNPPEETPAPTQEPVKQPETVKVPLSEHNFTQYFSVKFDTENFSNYQQNLRVGTSIVPRQHWQVDYVLTVTALTRHPYENVKFTAFNYAADYMKDTQIGGPYFSNLTMPQSGLLTKRETQKGSYLGYNYVSGSNPRILSTLPGDYGVRYVSGYMLMPYEEGMNALKALYEKAQKYMTQEKFDEAASLFSSLGDYEDAAQQLKAAEDAKKTREDARKQAAYEKALTDLQNGDYEAAESGFGNLGYYKDSYTKLNEVRKLKEEARLAQEESDRLAAYEAAAQLEKDGDYIAAAEAFTALGEYKDSPQRVESLSALKTIQEAQNLMAEDQYYSYVDAGKLLATLPGNEQAQALLRTCNVRTARPQLGSYLEKITPQGTYFAISTLNPRCLMDIRGNLLTEGGLFQQVGSWQDGLCPVMNKANLWGYMNALGEMVIPFQYTEAQDFHQGKALVKQSNNAYVIDTTGQVVAEMPAKKNRTYLSYMGEDLVAFNDNGKRGMINLQGKVVLKGKYTHSLGNFEHGLALASNRKNYKTSYAVINPKGKEVVKLGKLNQPTILSENMLVNQLGTQRAAIVNLKGKTLLTPSGNVHSISRKGDVIVTWTNSDVWTVYDLNLKQLVSARGDLLKVGDHSQVFAVKKDGGYQLYRFSNPSTPLLEKGAYEIFLSPDSPYVVVRHQEGGGFFIYDSEGDLIH